MVSDWQGGDISKLFPALSGKEDLSMGEDKKADKKRKRIVPKAPVQMIISREYVLNRISYALPLMRRSVAKQALNVILRGTRTNAIFGVGTA